jgi:hypothetical protein
MDKDVFVIVDIAPDPYKPELVLVKEKWLLRDGHLTPTGETILQRIRVNIWGPQEFRDLHAGLGFTSVNKELAICVTLTNKGTAAIDVDEVWFADHYEVPQPQEIAGQQAKQTATAIRLNPFDPFKPNNPRPFVGPLLPGKPGRDYVVQPDFMGSLKSIVASLSPDRYWFSVRSRGDEVLRVDGRELGDIIQDPA